MGNKRKVTRDSRDILSASFMIHKLDRILEFVEQNLQDSFDFLPWFYVTCLRTKDKAQQYEYIFRAVQMKQIKRRTKRITVFVGNYQRLEQQEV